MFGKAEAGEIVHTSVFALQLLGGMLKFMVSAPGFWVMLLASSMASRRVHCDTKTRRSTSQMPLEGLHPKRRPLS